MNREYIDLADGVCVEVFERDRARRWVIGSYLTVWGFEIGVPKTETRGAALTHALRTLRELLEDVSAAERELKLVEAADER